MKYVKLLLPILLIALMLLVPIQAFAADNPIQLFLNEKKLVPEVAPQIVNGGTTIVPVRIISEELGAKVSWIPKERQVKIERKDVAIVMTIDNKVATVNGTKQPALDAPPVIQEGNTLVPIRFVAEQFGLQVGWDGEAQAVKLFETEQRSETSGSGKDGGQAPAGGNGKDDKPVAGSSAGSGNPATKPDGTSPSDPGKPSGDGTPSAKPGDSAGTNGGKQPTDPAGGKGDGQGSNKPTEGTSAGTDGKPGGKGDAGNKALPVLTKLELSGENVIIETSGTAVPKTSTLTNPYRIIIDLPNAELGTFAKPGTPGQGSEIAVQHPKIDKIRYALFSDNPSTVRIVLDMKRNTDYQLKETKAGRQWSIDFQDRKYTVVIDAGHGGSDPGASSLNSRKEKDFTLPVANKVYKLLQQEASIKTIMTRTDDTYPTLDDRVQLANEAKADLFVSIHGNSFKQKPTISGTETYYSRTDSVLFAKLMHKWLLEATEFADRSVRQSDFKVIRETTMPALLLEVGYLTNAGDEAQMYSEPFQDRVAAAIVNGIKEQLQLSGNTPQTASATGGIGDKDTTKAGQDASSSKETKDAAEQGGQTGQTANDKASGNQTVKAASESSGTKNETESADLKQTNKQQNVPVAK
ncbi:N-acetylmuramoyl-L-alanine amidase [Paenibacillus hodogayensis]|uniref:N-acetylmuramoyl-L-alanine amidase n=1 Tax=Paenibacillus hodogayensis TaxID=279208 RepID=A0ABV5W575_9BACL